MGVLRVLVWVLGSFGIVFSSQLSFANNASFWGYSGYSGYSGGYGFRRGHRTEIISIDLNPQDLLNSSFRVAARENRYDDLKNLLKQGADVNSQSDRGDTALLYASRNCSKKMVNLLLKSEADVNIRDQEGYTPLIVAARGSCVPVVAILLKTPNIQIGTKDHGGKTALDYAEENGIMEVEGPPQEIIALLQKREKPSSKVAASNRTKPVS
jgi:ankyrin repeat protein